MPTRAADLPAVWGLVLDPLKLAEPTGSYPGGKGQAGVWQWIAAKMPAHATYVEPFAGKAAVARYKAPALRTILVDRHKRTCDWLRKYGPAGAEIVNGNGIDWLSRHGSELPVDAVVYCDPPYLLSTRVKKKLYPHELTAADHRRLLLVLRRLACRVLVSGYDSPLYRRVLTDWSCDAREVMTRGGTWRTECVWSNYVPEHIPPSALAVEYFALGKDYRERERVARRVRRWVASWRRMAATERAAVLRALLDASREANR